MNEVFVGFGEARNAGEADGLATTARSPLPRRAAKSCQTAAGLTSVRGVPQGF